MPNSRVQLPTGISWSGCLSSCSLNKKPSFLQLDAPTYRSQNVSSNRVTGWDDEGAQCIFFKPTSLAMSKVDVRGRRQRGANRASNMELKSSDVNLWHNQWGRLKKANIGVSSSIAPLFLSSNRFYHNHILVCHQLL